MKIVNTGTRVIRVSARQPGKLYNQTSGGDSGSPFPFDTADIGPGQELDLAGAEVVRTVELDEGTAVPAAPAWEPHPTPAEWLQHNQNGPSA